MSWSPWKQTRERIQSWSPVWTASLQGRYQRAGSPGQDFFRILYHSMKRFIEMRASESAAGLAYYALFSFFPLTLILVSLAGYLVGSELAYSQVVGFFRSALPFSGDVLDKNLQEVVRLRGPVGILGLIGMLWAASGFFSLLAHSINRAWPMVKLRSLVHNRLVALAMIAGLFALLLLSLLSSTLVSILPNILRLFTANGQPPEPGVWAALIRLVPAFFTLLLFILLYRRVPNKEVAWGAVLPGALFITVLWELAKLAFAFYVGSGVVRYDLVYGSLGALIALMFWIFFANMIALFGAYLVATIDQWLDLRAQQPEPDPSYSPNLPAGVRSAGSGSILLADHRASADSKEPADSLLPEESRNGKQDAVVPLEREPVENPPRRPRRVRG